MSIRILIFTVSLFSLSNATAESIVDLGSQIYFHDNQGTTFDAIEIDGPKAETLYNMLISNGTLEVNRNADNGLISSYVDTANVHCDKSIWLQDKNTTYECLIKVNY